MARCPSCRRCKRPRRAMILCQRRARAGRAFLAASQADVRTRARWTKMSKMAPTSDIREGRKRREEGNPRGGGQRGGRGVPTEAKDREGCPPSSWMTRRAVCASLGTVPVASEGYHAAAAAAIHRQVGGDGSRLRFWCRVVHDARATRAKRFRASAHAKCCPHTATLRVGSTGSCRQRRGTGGKEDARAGRCAILGIKGIASEAAFVRFQSRRCSR